MINRNNISTEMINVCYAIYDKTGNFSKIAATSILSLLENTESWVTIHILHDNTLSTENIKNFIYLARKYNQHIIFYNIEELLPTEISLLKQENQGRFSIAAMYRLLIMHLLPNTISKVIYLDCDTIVNIDIQDLYDEDIKNNVLGAVAECDATYNHAVEKDICNDGFVEQNNYFCSGILLINMDEYRKYASLCIDGIKFLAEHPSYDCPDQDILNYYFSNKYKKLSVKYNTFTKALKLKDINILSEQDESDFFRSMDEEDKKNMMIKEILEVFPEKKKQSVERALEMKKMIDLFAELFLPDGEEGGGFRLSSLADISNLGSISNLKLLGSLLRSLDDDDDEEQDEEENKEYEYVEVENYDVDEEEIYNSEESFEDDYDEYLEVNKAVSNNKKYNKNKSRKKRSKKEKRKSKTNV